MPPKPGIHPGPTASSTRCPPTCRTRGGRPEVGERVSAEPREGPALHHRPAGAERPGDGRADGRDGLHLDHRHAHRGAASASRRSTWRGGQRDGGILAAASRRARAWPPWWRRCPTMRTSAATTSGLRHAALRRRRWARRSRRSRRGRATPPRSRRAEATWSSRRARSSGTRPRAGRGMASARARSRARSTSTRRGRERPWRSATGCAPTTWRSSRPPPHRPYFKHTARSPDADLGELVAEAKPGRTDPGQRTIAIEPRARARRHGRGARNLPAGGRARPGHAAAALTRDGVSAWTRPRGAAGSRSAARGCRP